MVSHLSDSPSVVAVFRTKHFLRLTDQPPSYRGADMSLARPTSRYILFDGENISSDASLVIYIYIYIYIYSSNIPPVMIINRIYEHQNLLLL